MTLNYSEASETITVSVVPQIIWADGSQRSIYAARADGVLIDPADVGATSDFPIGLAVDDNFIYYTDVQNDSIYRANLDGTNPQVLISPAQIPGSFLAANASICARYSTDLYTTH